MISTTIVGALELKNGVPCKISPAGVQPYVSTRYRLDFVEVPGEDGSSHRISDLTVAAIHFSDYREEEDYYGMLGLNWLTSYPRVCLCLAPQRIELYIP